MRLSAFLALSAGMFIARADTVTLINNYGTAQGTFPAYYPIQYCTGNTCTGTEGYFDGSGTLSITGNTIPGTVVATATGTMTTTYIADPSGNISDQIVTTISRPSLTQCSPSPQCVNELEDVLFQYTSGLDLTGSPQSCGSVGGCSFVYSSGMLQTVGTISYSDGFSTTLQYESLIGTLLTTTLTNFNGGSDTNPVLLPSNQPVGEVTGTIGGFNTEDYYSFYWAGGFFSATSTIPNPSQTPGASYLFSEGSGSCTSGFSTNLNAADNFTGTISGNLAQGTYCIGIAANNAADPNFAMTFNTPTTATPEPSTAALLLGGLGLAAAFRRFRH